MGMIRPTFDYTMIWAHGYGRNITPDNIDMPIWSADGFVPTIRMTPCKKHGFIAPGGNMYRLSVTPLYEEYPPSKSMEEYLELTLEREKTARLSLELHALKEELKRLATKG